MKTALVFPGQGSQAVGMGKALADEFRVAREIFNRVDGALDQKLSHLMFEGPEDQLTLTANAQPALMATSIATLRVLETETGFNPYSEAAYVAGHSLGEYSALCAADSLTLEDTARLLRLRGDGNAEGCPGGRRRDGRHPRPRLRGGGEDRDTSGERPLPHRRDLPGRQ